MPKYSSVEVVETGLEDVCELENTIRMGNFEDGMEEVVEQMRALEIEQFANSCRYLLPSPVFEWSSMTRC